MTFKGGTPVVNRGQLIGNHYDLKETVYLIKLTSRIIVPQKHINEK